MRCLMIASFFSFSLTANAFDFTSAGIGATFNNVDIVNAVSKVEKQITLKPGAKHSLHCEWLLKQGFKPFPINGGGSGGGGYRSWGFFGNGKNDAKESVLIIGRAESDNGVDRLLSLTIKIKKSGKDEDVWKLKVAKKSDPASKRKKKTSPKEK